jgi:hypothetical protein
MILMANGILLFILGLIIGGVLVYVLINPSTINAITNSRFSSNLNTNIVQNSQLNACLSQIEAKFNIIEAKQPPDSTVSIANSTIFNKTNSNFTIINKWISAWTVDIYIGGGGWAVDDNCQGNPILISGGSFSPCKDFDTLLNNTNSSNNQTIGIGVALKVYEPNTQVKTRIYPLLCNFNGNLMTSSSNFLNVVS